MGICYMGISKWYWSNGVNRWEHEKKREHDALLGWEGLNSILCWAQRLVGLLLCDQCMCPSRALPLPFVPSSTSYQSTFPTHHFFMNEMFHGFMLHLYTLYSLFLIFYRAPFLSFNKRTRNMLFECKVMPLML